MNQAQFNEICSSIAFASDTEPTAEDGRFSLSIEGTDVLLDFDEEEGSDTLFFYLDLGEAPAHDRTQVFENLLAFNLRKHGTHSGTYAFDPGSARAIFCGRLMDVDAMNNEFIVELLRFYVDEAEEARRMVANSFHYASVAPNEGHTALLMSTLA